MTTGRVIQMALKIFANRLKRIRKERGLSQADLARQCELNLSDISRYERGTVSPTLENFVKIAQALEVTPDAMIFEKADRDIIPPKNLKIQQRLKDIEILDKNDQEAVLRLIDAMIAKRKMKDVIG